ncbi:efflux RND transporter periplasmic adaptor subunit [Helicobacter sp. MIT 05-5293]|uniref:efflux RND transporter periplasmic adaptor subunit n=1 Tax=Helicobacter sp. MIT 05-5293 TaxID=1548149 RepID=UPI00051D2759|nr:efflux RND transporter periplasmic adaptor subunit [Helicobacter sp. MIT 05-5293]TLD80407.1 efflux RND transporter periplasmic adaptor subunit [Helicobacter sp. MIT 05-5293]
MKNLLLTLVAFMIIFAGCKSNQQSQNANMSLPVSMQKVTPQAVNLSFEYPAKLKSLQSANVYARVEGTLTEKYFREGDIVQQGDKLFKIDPTRYITKVDMAKAQYANAQANLTKATKDWKRVDKLYKQGVYTIDQHDESLYNYQSAQANLANTKAALDDALIDLGYTDVTADFTGRTSMRNYDVGALVGRSGGNDILTTITQLSPIYAEFSIPNNDFYYMRGLNKENIQVEFILGNGKKYDHIGKMDFLDSVLDPQTLSIKARAIVDNNDYKLLPNEFVRVRLQGFEAQNGIAIPQSALMQDAQGSYVFVAQDGKAATARVTLGQSLKNNQILVMSGLKSGDILITSGLSKLRAGMGVVNANSNPNTKNDNQKSDSQTKNQQAQ